MKLGTMELNRLVDQDPREALHFPDRALNVAVILGVANWGLLWVDGDLPARPAHLRDSGLLDRQEGILAVGLEDEFGVARMDDVLGHDLVRVLMLDTLALDRVLLEAGSP